MMNILMNYFHRIFLFAALLLPVLNIATSKMEVYDPYKNDRLSKKILRGYIKAWQEKNGKLLLTPGFCNSSFVAIPNIHFEIIDHNEEYVTLETRVWGQKDTFDNTKASTLPKEKKLLSSKILKYNHNQVNPIFVDSSTKVSQRVLYDADRGTLKCVTKVPKQLFLAEIERVNEKAKVNKEALSESMVRAYLQYMKNGFSVCAKPYNMEFDFASEGKRVVLQTTIDGHGRDLLNFCSHYPSANREGSLTQKILAAYVKNTTRSCESVTKLDKHTKCNAPVYYDRADNGWMLCQTVLSLAQFEAIKNASKDLK